MQRILFVAVALLLPVCAANSQGTGLTGQYYDTETFGTLKTTRVDAAIDFSWGSGIPSGTAITSGDTFSVAWNGQIEPEFTQLYTFHITADDGVRLWVDEQLIALRTFAQNGGEMRGQVRLVAGKRVNLRLEYIEQTGNASVKLEWSAASRAREIIPTSRLYPTRVDRSGGSLLKETWAGVAGSAISNLTSIASYPDKPSGRELITTFECLAQNWADSFGTRVTGYIVPEITGSYVFAVSGEDVAQLYLSTDATTANKALIANTSGATGYRQWDAQASQQSTPRVLVQGQRYYVELLHKEDTGADHWSVGWKTTGDASFSVVPGKVLRQAGIERTQPSQAALLDTMARQHPRIFTTAERFAWLRTQWLNANSSKAKTWAQNSINSANTVLTQPPNTYSPDNRGTILGISRSVKDRMYHLGLAWWLTGDNQYAERAWTELDAVAAYPDWHPAHFLDTAEMTHAFAIGYDWFYSYWTTARRDAIRNAMITKGLNAGLSQYTSNVGWSRSTGNNWNLVCNGGLTMGALALGTENESLSEDILNRAINSARPVLKHFTTDNGNWYEGPGYWGYTMEYGMRMLAGLEWVLGSDFGLGGTRNLGESGFLPMYGNGSSNIIFNYADAGAGGAGRGPEFAWLARRYGQPLFSWWQNQASSGGALGALWQQDASESLQNTAAAPDFAFHGEVGSGFEPQEMVTMRGNWTDSRTTFIGVKAGHMGADHGNLDAGTFVLDALGKRWFHDLGGDDYALPGYFTSTPNANGTDRWDYYRMRAEGQNTLVINPGSTPDLVLNSVPPLIGYQSEPGGSGSFAIHDLTPAHAGMTRVWRGARLMGARDEMLVQDEIVAGSGKTVWWFAHYTYPTTTVAIDPDGTSAMLTQGAERMWCKIVSGGGVFQIMDAVPLPTSPNPAGQNANTGYRKLAIPLSNVTNTTLAVWFVPLSPGESVPASVPVITPLNTWNLAASNDPPNAINGNGTLDADNAVDIDLRNYVTDDATPAEQMRFSVGASVNGTVVLLPDGHTARFTPTPGYAGVPNFTFTATDTTADPRTVLAYDFDLPDTSDAAIIPDVSGHGRDGGLDAIGTGAVAFAADVPGALGREGRSLDLLENGGANAARLSRVISSAELNFNTSDWTITGWFKRRDAGNDDMVWHLNNGDGFGTNEELYLMASAANRLQLHHYPGPDVDISTTTAPPGAWRHFAVVRSGATFSVYLDGALVGADSAFALAINQTFPLIFGGHTDTSATYAPRWLDGGLDELAVFSAALSPGEIMTLAGGMTVRHFGGLSATGTITLSAAPVTHNWTSATSGAWSVGANWQSAAAPASSRGATVQFFNGATVAAGSITADQNIAGDFQLNVLTLAGTGSATTATISNGSMTLLNNGALNPTVNLNATAGGGFSYDIATPIALAAPVTFTGNGSATFRFNGNISGVGGIAKSGTSALILTGDNSFAGDTVITAGTLQIGNDGGTGDLGSGSITNNGLLRFDRTGTLNVPNGIGGTGEVRIDCPIGAGSVVLAGTSTFSGLVNVNSGALRITNSSALGEGSKLIKLTNGTAGNPQLRLDGSNDPIDLPADFSLQTSNDTTGAIINEAGNNSIAGSITLTAGGGSTRIVSLAGTLTLGGDISPNATGRTLKLMGAGSGFINGVIRDGVAPNVLSGIAKSDAGTWTLNGAATHTGSVSITAGALFINGGTTAASGVSVSAGATLGGVGTINAAATITGFHAPGDAGGTGTQAFAGSISYGGASRLQWQLGANDTATADRVVAATASITSGAKIDVALNPAGGTAEFTDAFWGVNRTWPVLTANTITGAFQLGTVTGDSAGRGTSGFGTFSLSQNGTAVNLVWTAASSWQQWQAAHFGANWSNAAIAGPGADPDKDGLSNDAERIFGTDPNTPAAAALLSIERQPAAQVLVSFTAAQASGIGYTNLTRRYTLERTADIANSTSWQAVPGYEAIAGNDQLVTLPEPAGTLVRFSYRLRVSLQ